jgi:hypothetical protein
MNSLSLSLSLSLLRLMNHGLVCVARSMVVDIRRCGGTVAVIYWRLRVVDVFDIQGRRDERTTRREQQKQLARTVLYVYSPSVSYHLQSVSTYASNNGNGSSDPRQSDERHCTVGFGRTRPRLAASSGIPFHPIIYPGPAQHAKTTASRIPKKMADTTG